MPTDTLAQPVAAALRAVQRRLADAALRHGRAPADVTLVAVSKTHPGESVEAALAAVESGESTCDGVASATGLSGPAAAAALAQLELLGYLACSSLGTYSRTLVPSISKASL